MVLKLKINIEAVIKHVMKKARNHHDRRYGFGGLLTRFLRWHGIEEEALDFNPLLEMRPVDVTKMRALDISHEHILPECHAQDNEIATHMYGLQML